MVERTSFLEVIEETEHALDDASKIRSIEEEMVGGQLKLLRRRLNPVYRKMWNIVYISSTAVVDLGEKKHLIFI